MLYASGISRPWAVKEVTENKQEKKLWLEKSAVLCVISWTVMVIMITDVLLLQIFHKIIILSHLTNRWFTVVKNLDLLTLSVFCPQSLLETSHNTASNLVLIYYISFGCGSYISTMDPDDVSCFILPHYFLRSVSPRSLLICTKVGNNTIYYFTISLDALL